MRSSRITRDQNPRRRYLQVLNEIVVCSNRILQLCRMATFRIRGQSIVYTQRGICWKLFAKLLGPSLHSGVSRSQKHVCTTVKMKNNPIIIRCRRYSCQLFKARNPESTDSRRLDLRVSEKSGVCLFGIICRFQGHKKVPFFAWCYRLRCREANFAKISQ